MNGWTDYTSNKKGAPLHYEKRGAVSRYVILEEKHRFKLIIYEKAKEIISLYFSRLDGAIRYADYQIKQEGEK